MLNADPESDLHLAVCGKQPCLGRFPVELLWFLLRVALLLRLLPKGQCELLPIRLRIAQLRRVLVLERLAADKAPVAKNLEERRRGPPRTVGAVASLALIGIRLATSKVLKLGAVATICGNPEFGARHLNIQTQSSRSSSPSL